MAIWMIPPPDLNQETHECERNLLRRLKIKSNLELYTIIDDFLKWEKNSSNQLTIMDLLPVEWTLKKDDIRKILETIFKTKNVSKILKRINVVYKENINFIDSVLLRKLPEWYHEKEWKNLDEFIDYVYDTVNWKSRISKRITDCVILKTMCWVDKLLESSKLAQVVKDLDETLFKFKNIEWISTYWESDNWFYFIYNKPIWSKKSWPEHLKWYFVFRKKKVEKIILKTKYNRKYNDVNLLNDLVAFYIEINEWEEEKATKFLLENMFSEKYKLDTKWWMLSGEFINQNKIKLRWQWTKNSTWETFQNISIIGEIPYWKNLQEKTQEIEAQIVKIKNKNNAWFNNHNIYDMLKFLSATCRDQWYLTIEDIKISIQEIWIYSWIPEKNIIHYLLFPTNNKAEKWDNSGFLIPLEYCNSLFFVTSDTYSEDIHKIYENYPKINKNSISEDDMYKNFIERYENTSTEPKYKPIKKTT